MRHYVFETFSSRQFTVVITTQNIPHNYLISEAQHIGLRDSYLGVGRSVQVGIYQIICNIDILNIIVERFSPSCDMAIGMISNRMTSTENLLEKVGIQLYIFTDTEKGSFCIKPVQSIQHPGGNFGAGAIIKSEKQRISSMPGNW